jgi:hypothetical protein
MVVNLRGRVAVAVVVAVAVAIGAAATVSVEVVEEDSEAAGDIREAVFSRTMEAPVTRATIVLVMQEAVISRVMEVAMVTVGDTESTVAIAPVATVVVTGEATTTTAGAGTLEEAGEDIHTVTIGQAMVLAEDISEVVSAVTAEAESIVRRMVVAVVAIIIPVSTEAVDVTGATVAAAAMESLVAMLDLRLRAAVAPLLPSSATGRALRVEDAALTTDMTTRDSLVRARQINYVRGLD